MLATQELRKGNQTFLTTRPKNPQASCCYVSSLLSLKSLLDQHADVEGKHDAPLGNLGRAGKRQVEDFQSALAGCALWTMLFFFLVYSLYERQVFRPASLITWSFHLPSLPI